MARYYRRYYRRRYRRYLRRYLYRKNKKYANRISLNYYKAKINYSFAVFKQNNEGGDKGIGYKMGTLAWGTPGDSLNIADVLRGNADYQNYIPIYDEVRLLGIAIQAFPSPRNVNLTTAGVSHVPVGLQYKFDQMTAYNNPLLLNPIAYSKKFWRNSNRKTWSPISLTSAEIANQVSIPGYLTINAPTDTIVQNASPSWNCMMNIYVQFRKNKNN
jgi:hypothetical protein